MREIIPESITINEISKIDRDSLHTLPLLMLPIENLALKRARLIKNARLDSVVEIFTDENTGSGQLEVDSLMDEFGWDTSKPPDDFIMVKKLAALPSYDVYSLRLSLRELGIDVEPVEALTLSREKTEELNSYMTSFTHPLILQIYGGDDDIQTFEDVLKKFSDPDIKNALKKIRMMSEKLGISPEEIPGFMENYGDIFLSLSFYRECLDSIKPILNDFLTSLQDLKSNFQLKNDKNLMSAIDPLESIFNSSITEIISQLDSFDQGSKTIWENISAEKFENMKKQVINQHTSIGSTLCSMSVKLKAWHNLFPNENSGGPGKRAEFIMLEMRQGFEKIAS